MPYTGVRKPKYLSWYDYILSRGIRQENGCLIWQGATQKGRGYGQAMIDYKPWLVHRYVVWYNIKDLMPLAEFELVVVRHSCDTPPCIEPSHLLVGSQGDNLQDAYDRNRRSAKGQDNAFSKFTELEIREIRDKYASGLYTQVQLANEYGTPQANISSIVLRKSWAHVE